jgi:hypothetical protein
MLLVVWRNVITVLLYAIFWSCQGSFTLNCPELFVVCVGSTGADREDGVAKDPAHDWSCEEVLRDKEKF